MSYCMSLCRCTLVMYNSLIMYSLQLFWYSLGRLNVTLVYVWWFNVYISPVDRHNYVSLVLYVFFIRYELCHCFYEISLWYRIVK